jgi:imidazolonepropionase-like amidohydrolase
MKKLKSILFYIFIGVLCLIGIGLLCLTNQGIVSFRKPYARQLAKVFQPNQRVVAFEDVNVIPMVREQILMKQTVTVQDGFITQIGDSNFVEVPSDALRIDGTGKYLIPGLTDMHVHVKEENELLLFVANGVTSIRNMWGGAGALRLMGFPDHLAWRQQIENGDMFGPTLYTSGPIMEGPPKTMPLMEVYDTPEAAAAAVSWQVAQGYDFIKVYDYLDLPTYQAVIETAHGLNVEVAGHVPKAVGLERALASGQKTIEHLSGFIDNDAGEYIISEGELESYARKTKQAGVWVCPTIAVYQMYVLKGDLHLLEDRPEMAFVSPGMKLTWQYFSRPGSMNGITYQGDYPARIREMFLSTTRILHENGVEFILGTDADNPYLVPGFSLLDELDYLIEAGFTPYEALEAGTRNPAQAMGKLNEFGTVEVGKRADLILVNGNPLDNIRQLRSHVGVMLRGRWLPQTSLQAVLDQLADSRTPSLFERVWPVSLLGLSIYLIWRNALDQQGE